MREIYTEIEIQATAARVWEILLGFAEYPDWNPFIRQIEGAPAVGERLQTRAVIGRGEGMRFQPTVTRVAPGREFRWRGHLLAPWLSHGEHIFEIEPRPAGGVRFVHRQTYGGPLTPLLWPFFARKTRDGFARMNEALKERAERAEAAGLNRKPK